jgi:hypothetical protein
LVIFFLLFPSGKEKKGVLWERKAGKVKESQGKERTLTTLLDPDLEVF